MSLHSILEFFDSRDIAVAGAQDELLCSVSPNDLTEDVRSYLRDNKKAIQRFLASQPFQFYHSPRYNAGSPCLARFRSGAKGNLFCIHPITGTSWCYSRIVEGIDADVSVYGIYAPGFGTDWITPSLTEMAEIYACQIKERQPKGPYWICGYSMGGTLAIDTARVLRNAGDEVRPVCIIDTRLLDGVAAKIPSARRAIFTRLPAEDAHQPLHVWEFFVGIYFGWDMAKAALSDPAFLDGDLQARLGYLLEEGRRRDVLNRWWREEDIQAIFRFQTKLMREAGEYRSRTYEGTVAYFFGDKEKDQAHAVEFLNLISGGYRLIQCSGTHISMMFDPANATGLGEKISTFIRNFEEKRPAAEDDLPTN
jgi:pimeloyl-ACP methyl ester carboxylesterase